MDLGRLAPASEVTGGHTLPGHDGLPILKWYGMSFFIYLEHMAFDGIF
jgi:hypothetical protein